MPRIVDLMQDLEWSEEDLVNRCRSMVNSVVSEARQDELRTIMLGHIAGMRVATEKELGEIALVKSLAESTGQDLLQGRADMALLREVWAYETAQKALGDDPSDAQAQAVTEAASDDAKEVAAQRAALRPAPEPEVPVDPDPTLGE